MRMTFDYHDNEHKMSDFLTKKTAEIARAIKPREFHEKPREGHYEIEPYQTTHNTGVRAWDRTRSTASSTAICNIGMSLKFVRHGLCRVSAEYPTGTFGALTFWAADAIKNKYLKPGSVSADVRSIRACRWAGPLRRMPYSNKYFQRAEEKRSLARRHVAGVVPT